MFGVPPWPYVHRNNVLQLAVCTSLFALRVLGQALVVTRAPPLASFQRALVLGATALQISTAGSVALSGDHDNDNSGSLSEMKPFFATDGWNRAAPILIVISGVYFVSMALRYVLTMALHPERRWFKRTIPIWFHMVLAIALWAFADYLR